MKLFVIEDDEWSRRTLLKFVKSYFPDIELLGYAENIEDSRKMLSELNPDFILADIKLGDGNIFDFMNDLQDIWRYNFVLMTSHKEYALQAISKEVVDYIIKPVTLENLTLAINKVRRKLNDDEKNKLSGSFTKSENRILGIASINTIEVINMDSIVYIQADGRYTHFHLLNGSKKTASKNLGEYEKLLPNQDFLRVHNSYIVNMNYVKSVTKTDGYLLELFKSENLIPIAKRKQDAVVKFLQLRS